MDDQLDFQHIRRDLERQRRELLRLMGQGDDQPILDEEENPDNTVMARDYQMLEVESRLDSLNGDRVERINRALERLDNGAYGQCRECGRSIPMERLRVNPAADLCSDCQARQDQEATPWNA